MRYIAGGLSATMNDSDWVMTSYLAANATTLPITGWLSARLGRRRYFLLSIAVFTAASVLCGLATSLEQLMLFRVIQGLAGGGLQPASQGILIGGARRGESDPRRASQWRPWFVRGVALAIFPDELQLGIREVRRSE